MTSARGDLPGARARGDVTVACAGPGRTHAHRAGVAAGEGEWPTASLRSLATGANTFAGAQFWVGHCLSRVSPYPMTRSTPVRSGLYPLAPPAWTGVTKLSLSGGPSFSFGLSRGVLQCTLERWSPSPRWTRVNKFAGGDETVSPMKRKRSSPKPNVCGRASPVSSCPPRNELDRNRAFQYYTVIRRKLKLLPHFDGSLVHCGRSGSATAALRGPRQGAGPASGRGAQRGAGPRRLRGGVVHAALMAFPLPPGDQRGGQEPAGPPSDSH